MSEYPSEPTAPPLLIGEAATGTINPESRGLSPEAVAQFSERLKGDTFYITVPAGRIVPCGCVDGRCRIDGQVDAAPNAAGGSESLVIADALTSQHYMNPEGTVAEHANAMYSALHKGGHKVGGHRDTHASEAASGCGANDKLGLILGKILEQSSAIRTVIESLGVKVSDEVHQLIVGRANDLAAGSYAQSAGAPMTEATLRYGGEGAAPVLDGDHNEVAVVINLRHGTTLDREALRNDVGDEMQAFNVDVWALKGAIELIASSDEEVEAVFVASLYFNVATALTLAGPSLQIVVRT